jgi:hypothetical protein
MDINLLKALFSRIADYFPDNIFHEGKGHSATRERAFFVSFENLGAALAPLPLPPLPTPLILVLVIVLCIVIWRN